jgi:acyl-CoA dehydrogenase
MLTLSEEQVLLDQAARAFLAEKAPVAQLRRLRDSGDQDGFNRATWREMAAMGWAGVLVAEEHGGVDFGHVAAGLLCERMGRNLVASPFLSSAILGATALRHGRSPALAERWLPAIAAGEVLMALAVDEGRKHDPAATRLTATPHGNGFRLHGTKVLVLDGHVAHAFVVAARSSGAPAEAAGLSLFLVEVGSPGLEVTRNIMVDSRNAASVRFDGVAVDGAAMLGEAGEGWELLERVLDAGRAAVAAELLGVSGEVFERTLVHLKGRRQFGRPIGSFQALQHRAAHLYCEIEMLRSAVLAAGQALDADAGSAGPVVSMAKAKAAEVARLAVAEAVQMHGGIGMTDEIDIGLFMKRARAAAELLGDAAFHAERVARHRGF